MPIIDAEQSLEQKTGWGCAPDSSWRIGEPTPEQAFKALARSASVTVEPQSDYSYVTWTVPGQRYVTVFGKGPGTGFCKHVVAAAFEMGREFMPWARQMQLGAAAALDELEALRKEVVKLRKEKAKWEKQKKG